MKSYTINALQLAYLGALKEDKQEETVCPMCWSNGCNCNIDTKNDPFLNMTDQIEFKYA
jgi:hypothetical protein